MDRLLTFSNARFEKSLAQIELFDRLDYGTKRW